MFVLASTHRGLIEDYRSAVETGDRLQAELSVAVMTAVEQEERSDGIAAENDRLKAVIDELSARPQVATAVVVEDQSRRLLLLRRSASGTYPGTWCLPGGRLEPDESLEGCCRRELKEEVGLEATSFDFSAVTEITGPPHLIGLVYRAKVVIGAAINAEPSKHDEIGWFGREDLPSPLMPGVAMWLGMEGATP